MTIFYLVRHGEVNKNATGGYDFDPRLSDKGIQQAMALSQDLKDIFFDQIYSSTKLRAIETALVFSHSQKEITVIPALTEAQAPFAPDNKDGLSNLGQDPTFFSLPESQKFAYKFPDGSETLEQIYNRFNSVLASLCSKYPTQTIAIFSHTLAIRTVLMGLGYDTATNLTNSILNNCGYVVLESQNSNLVIKNVVGLVAR